jgi:hypothetical protein
MLGVPDLGSIERFAEQTTDQRPDGLLLNPPIRVLLTAKAAELLAQIKAEVLAGRARAARVVDTEVIELYWRIGKLLPGAVGKLDGPAVSTRRPGQ